MGRKNPKREEEDKKMVGEDSKVGRMCWRT
jgi:hypothetical protein